MLFAFERNEDAGLVYADYTQVGDEEREVHLLKHHVGRVRDNQDTGRAWMIRVEAAGRPPFDPALQFHELYDLRLRIAEAHQLVHVANRYAGSLYHVRAAAKGHNVFDYLLASKESQLEAERVVTEHLKRIGAYLAPGQGYRPRPASGDAKLKASVVIPVNNRPDFIGIAIESVLEQTVPEVEVIVVINGGPDDPTAAAVQRYQPGGDRFRENVPAVRLIVLDVNNIGLCLNSGIAAAEGAVYVQLDSDDRLKPDAVEKVLTALEGDPHAGIVIGSYEVWQQEADGRRFRREEIPVVTHDEWTEENGRNNLLRINGAGAPRCIPVEVVKEMGWFSINDEPFSRNYGEDYDMVLRISERYRVGRIWEPIYEVVRHAGGTDHSIDFQTIDRNDEAKDWMRREAIMRRQALLREGGAS
jgi:glycosyltransferase involved in cell wall biosynthesis